jgi:hypothetical protein
MKTSDRTMTVKCPKCAEEFPLTTAITEPLRHEVEESLRQQFDRQLVKEKENWEKEFIEKAAKKRIADQIRDIQDAIGQLNEELKLGKGNEAKLRSLIRRAEREKENLELDVSRRVDEQTGKAR